MSESLFESMINKYGYFQEIIDNIANIKSYDSSSICSLILKNITDNKIDCQVIYDAIRCSCEINISCIREYWSIFDEIYQKTKIKPKNRDDTYIINALFARKYIEGDSDLCHFHHKSFDEILNYYESNPILSCIIHDDIKSLKEIIISDYHFDFEKKFFNKSLIEYSCFCGSIECFKFLRSNGIKITNKCLNYSIDGKAKFIINECLQYQKPNNDTMNEIIKIHDFEMAVSFEQMYGLEIPVNIVADYLDIRLFCYLMSTANNFDIYFLHCFSFRLLELFDDILRLKPSLETRNENNTTPLFFAAKFNFVNAITKLIKLGTKVNTTNKYNLTPIFFAAVYNNVEAISILILHGANVNIDVGNGGTPFYYAAFNHSIEAMTILAKSGARINTRYLFDQNILMQILSVKKVDIININNSMAKTITKLIELGENINHEDSLHHNALINAVQYHKIDAIPTLIKFGANIEAAGGILGGTPLIYAVHDSQVEIVVKLVELGANIEGTDRDGDTPLHRAVMDKKMEMVTKLVELGANIEGTDRYGDTPLKRAVKDMNIEMVTKLVELGANINVRNKDGDTPIYWIIMENNAEMVKKLIELGAKINVRNKDGKTPLWNARNWDDFEYRNYRKSPSRGQIIKILLEHGAHE